METELVVCQHRVKLNAGASIQGGGEFEITAITAGGGNGWEFSETCLRESLPLWEGAQCFIDHQWQGHSVRDLAGVCRSPVWDAARRGVVVRLKAMGPSAGVL
ncbi:MAG: hypothetical protein U1B80_00710, partial [Anaerolineaceae bacterium]|nr:hypothetical protein [Anaerolineaceae bacterium]